jgi:hypothetical protein
MNRIQDTIAHQNVPEDNQKISRTNMGKYKLNGKIRKYRPKIKTISHNCKERNDTKNIPKNFGKAILSFIQRNISQTTEFLQRQNFTLTEFMMAVKKYKKEVNSLSVLK